MLGECAMRLSRTVHDGNHGGPRDYFPLGHFFVLDFFAGQFGGTNPNRSEKLSLVHWLASNFGLASRSEAEAGTGEEGAGWGQLTGHRMGNWWAGCPPKWLARGANARARVQSPAAGSHERPAGEHLSPAAGGSGWN